MNTNEFALKLAIAYMNRKDENVTEEEFFNSLSESAGIFKELIDDLKQKKLQTHSNKLWDNL